MRIVRLICALFIAVGLLAIPVLSRAQVAVGISVRIGPPVLPGYVQPICPGPGFIWVPGYWAYGPDGYFWVPGTWVFPPEEGLLWTPGYWDWDDGFYIWHEGYWGPVVGFYGGINYGFGYPGVGFYGGYWRGGTYFYNRSVTNVDVTVVRNTYNTTVVNNNTTINRVSFNGGPGGTTARPTAVELAAARQPHSARTSVQVEHQQTARGDRALLASVNHGRPDVAASPRPGEFHGHGPLVKERPENPNRGPKNRDEMNRPGNAPDVSSRPMNREDRPGRQPENNRRTFEDRPPSSRPSNAPVNPKLEQKQQKELEKMRQQQEAEHQKMQRQHDQEQRQLQQRNANQPRQEQLQRRQEQQTQQMERKHDQQSQKLQERQQKEQQKQERKPPQDRKPSGLH